MVNVEHHHHLGSVVS